jgi:ATP-dependent DNA helicase DinG
MQVDKPIRVDHDWPNSDFQGLLLTSPKAWLDNHLTQQDHFPPEVPTILDGADDLEIWTRQQLTVSLYPKDWDELMLAFPGQAEIIRNTRVQLTRAVFQHPANPYNCYLIDQPEQDVLTHLYSDLEPLAPTTGLKAWRQFWKSFRAEGVMAWAEVTRRQGQFSLHCAPVEVASALREVWLRQPVVLIGGALDLNTEAPLYRQRLGLEELTTLKFSPDRHEESIQLYLPDGIPLPNTPQFQTALIQEVYSLLRVSNLVQGLAVLIVDDLPLKAQVGSVLAAEFGSRVQVEKTCLDDNGVLVTGWEFWQQYQAVFPAPHLLVIATLPIPSLEDPRVAGRVAYYKQLRQDWFRLYLLPETLNKLQRAIAPVREQQGVVALLDSRVIHRSYGKQVLAALSPWARVNYLDPSLFTQADYTNSR